MDQEKSQSHATAILRSGSRSVFRSVAATRLLLKKQIWIWPIIAAVLLAAVGWIVRERIETQIRDDVASEVQTILQIDVQALRLWMNTQETTALSIVAAPRLAALCEKLVEQGSRPEATQLELLQSPALQELRDELVPVLAAQEYVGFVLANRQGRIVASQRNELVGVPVPKEDGLAVQRALAGKTTISPPRKSLVFLPDKSGELKLGLPTMFAWAPLKDAKGDVIAALGLRIRPDDDFTAILQMGRAGVTGETYAINRDGIMVSNSRFEDDLRRVGLIRDDEESILNLQVRNPDVDMTQGQRPDKRRADQPLTLAAAQAIEEHAEGVNVAGYRDYRGVPVVGAWKWLDEYDLGVVTEQDVADAFAPLYSLRQVFWGMFVLLGAAALAIFVFTLVVARLNREARHAALHAKRLGQYALDEKLGEGGMGVVYRAHHALLHRPTAVKFLHVEKTNENSVARFEREVQITAGLNHPNTIAIYDYGRTPEGIFYYAMEFLEGINLEDLVRRFGPQPEARAVFILQQALGSLAEAHRAGLIHRDIKPANIMLTERGGMCDFAKLLDFGLVKAVDAKAVSTLTSAGALTGTPLYLSPEAIRNTDEVDTRSDLYAIGAVGYYLVTGTPVFDGRSVLDILQQHSSAAPEPLSQRLGRPVSAELESLLLKCLAKKPEERPATAEALMEALAACHVTGTWTFKDAERWWSTHGLRPGVGRSALDTARLQATVVGPASEV